MHFKYLLPFVFFLFPVLIQAEDISLRNEIPHDQNSQWSGSLGRRNLQPYYEDEQNGPSDSGKLDRSYCIPDHRCNFMKKGIVDSLRSDANREAFTEINTYQDVLRNSLLKKSQEFTHKEEMKIDSLKKEILQDISSYSESFSQLSNQILEDNLGLEEAYENEQGISKEEKDLLDQWLEESTTYFTDDLSISDALRKQMEGYPYKTPFRSEEGQKLLRLHGFAQSVRSQIRFEDLHYEKRISLVDEADLVLETADDFFVEQDKESGNFAIEIVQDLLDLAISFAPPLWKISLGKSAYEAVTGVDLLSFEPLDPVARVGAIIDLATLGLGSKFVKTSKIVRKISSKGGRALQRLEKQADELFDYAKKHVAGRPHGKLDSRRKAFNLAKRDAGIPKSAQPLKVDRVPMKDRNTKLIFDENHKQIDTLEYHYKAKDGKIAVIQDHSAGHKFGEGGVGDQGPHFNVRKVDPATGKGARNENFPGVKDHYFFER